jgi:DNA-directed RNA polymerase subunit RPC12/RpoP
MTEYYCSTCGGKIEVVILACYPPITQYRCQKCGARKEVRDIMTPEIINMTGPHFEYEKWPDTKPTTSLKNLLDSITPTTITPTKPTQNYETMIIVPPRKENESEHSWFKRWVKINGISK